MNFFQTDRRCIFTGIICVLQWTETKYRGCDPLIYFCLNLSHRGLGEDRYERAGLAFHKVNLKLT